MGAKIPFSSVSALCLAASLMGLAVTSAGAEVHLAVEREAAGKQLSILRDPASVTVWQGDRLLLEYRYGNVTHKPYVIQLLSPRGVNILRDAPADHLHHHGLMFAWRVGGVNFWEEGLESGREVHVRWRELRVAKMPGADDSDEQITERARLREQLRWQGPDGNVLLEEDRLLIVPMTGSQEPCIVTWQSTLTTQPDNPTIEITGTQYNGLGARFVQAMDAGGRFHSELEGKEIERTGGLRSRWCAYTAEPRPGKLATVVVFDAPSNPRHPATWYTKAEPFAYLAATLALDRQPLTLRLGEPLTLRYGIGVLDGTPHQKAIDAIYARWQELSSEDRKHSIQQGRQPKVMPRVARRLK